MKSFIYGKKSPPVGTTPAIILQNPKYARNIGAIVRAASCWGIKQVWFTGDRAMRELEEKGATRLPREERMRDYDQVELINFDYPFDAFPKGIVPVAIEVRENSENLVAFDHPQNAVYVFGPEDGSIDQAFLRHCHRFVIIPTNHCLNIAAAVNVVLYDMVYKNWLLRNEALPVFNENRMFSCSMEG